MPKIEELAPAIEETASGAIDAYKACAVIDGVAVYADQSVAAHRHNVRGLSIASVSDGQTTCIQVVGPIVNESWAWTANMPVYLSTSGNLTQTKPTTGTVLLVATAKSATELYINIGRPEDAASHHSHVRETFTISPSDLANKFVLLGQTPLETASVHLYVEGAGHVRQALDFEMDGANPKKLTWSGLVLDGLLASGDVLVARYYKGVD